ncbi:MAG: TorF family putative porin [Duganella sp.]
MPARTALALLALLLTMAPGQARAQAQVDITGSVALQSEYRYRGQNPGHSNAVPQATINLDTDRGWYGGAFASAMTIGDLRGYKLQGYAGYAQRMRAGGSWELGCSRITYTQAHENDFSECYGGINVERGSARLYYSPQYLGYPARVVYGEINAFYPVHPRFNLVGHVGLMHNLSGGFFPGIPSDSRYDLRVGVGIPFGNWTLQIAREYVQDDGRRYTMYPVHPPRQWSMGLSYAF